ncbi:MAG TPA: hypothetical protein VL128_05365 [Candidatus Eisenbacteria bacterium]|nr:hypothetical protein [Candidatus Eisenbacteria bacterium]
MNLRAQSVTRSPWVICGAALALRLAFLFHQAHAIPDRVLAEVPFQNEVGSVAAALANGEGYCCLFRQPTGPTAWLAPVYPLLLAGIFKMFGIFSSASFYAAAICNCIFSALVCLPLYHVARRVGNQLTPPVAGWLWVVFPSGILLPFEWIWDTSLSALLGAALLWATVVLPERPRRRSFLWYGLFCGFCLLANPALGAVYPLFFLWIFWKLRSRAGKAFAGILSGAALTVLVCLPWALRNAVQFHRLIPIRSDFPFELWMGNNPIYDPDSREVSRITRYEQVHLYAQLGETAYLDQKSQAARAFIRTHPGLWLRLAGRRAVAWWLGTSVPWSDFQKADSLLARVVIAWNALTLLGTIAGLGCVLWTRRAYFFPLIAFPALFPLAYYVTQVSLRLRHPCDPSLALLMAIGATWPLWRRKEHANAR